MIRSIKARRCWSARAAASRRRAGSGADAGAAFGVRAPGRAASCGRSTSIRCSSCRKAKGAFAADAVIEIAVIITEETNAPGPPHFARLRRRSRVWRAFRAQTPAVKIGVLTDLSGPYRDNTGEGSVACARQAADEFGAGTVSRCKSSPPTTRTSRTLARVSRGSGSTRKAST